MSRQVYTKDQIEEIAKLRKDIAIQLKDKQKRLSHSLSVAACAKKLAEIYNQDQFICEAAGLLHDWDKATSNEELFLFANENNIDLGVKPEYVLPLLHGIVSSIKLKSLYPELDYEVFSCIRYHTTGSSHLTPCEMIVFIADAIEENRPATPSIVELREMVGKVDLEELYFKCFCMSMMYVVETARYLWPGTLDIYNEIVLKRNRK